MYFVFLGVLLLLLIWVFGCFFFFVCVLVLVLGFFQIKEKWEKQANKPMKQEYGKIIGAGELYLMCNDWHVWR